MDDANKYAHKVGEIYVERIGDQTVRYTVAELVARTESELDHEEVIRTGKGQCIHCMVDRWKLTLLPDKEALLAFLAKELHYGSNRDLFEKLGGNIDEAVPEV